MNSCLALEICFLLLRSAVGENCKQTQGTHVSQMGPVSTLSCSHPKQGIEYDKSSRNLQKSSFIRVMCSDEDEYVGLEKKNVAFFCTDDSCPINESEFLSKHIQLLFNKTVIRDTKENQIYYCLEFQWISLSGRDLPQSLRISRPSTITYPPTHWTEGSKINKSDSHRIFDDNEQDLENFPKLRPDESKLTNRQSKQLHTSSADMCLIAIILSIVCSVFFVIVIVLLVSSRLFIKHQIRDKLMVPRGNCGEVPIQGTDPVKVIEVPSPGEYVAATEFCSKLTKSNSNRSKKINKDIEARNH